MTTTRSTLTTLALDASILATGCAADAVNQDPGLLPAEPPTATVYAALKRAIANDVEFVAGRLSGHHRPKLKDRSGTEALLNELKRRGLVSSFNHALLGGIKANLRH